MLLLLFVKQKCTSENINFNIVDKRYFEIVKTKQTKMFPGKMKGI